MSAPARRLSAMVHPEERRLGLRRAAAAAALFLVLAIALTWPLAAKLGRSTPDEFRDARITAWVLAWDAHVLHTDPTDLFQAPIFFPELDALVFTDHMLGIGVFAAPVTWVTGNVYVGHNVVFIASVALAAFAAMLAAFELTGSYSAALVAGAAFGFAPYWVNHSMHVQFLAAGWIPMSVYGLLRWWRTGGVRALAIAAGSAVMAALTSWYQAAFVLVAIVVIALTLLVANRPDRLRRTAIHGAFAAIVAAAMLYPFVAPYRRMQARYPGYTRTVTQVAKLSALPESYLAAPPSNLIYGRATARWSQYPRSVEQNLFPGVAVVLLASVGIAGRKRGRSERAAATALLLVTAAGVLLSFGAASSGVRSYLPWTFLSDHVVLFKGLRAAARAHVLVVLGLSLLAAFGIRSLLGRIRRGHVPVAALVFALIVAEGAAVPRNLGSSPHAPPAYALLSRQAGGVLELPLGRRFDADYMLFGIAHWRPLANGIAGYTPLSYHQLEEKLKQPPDAALMDLLRSRGIRTLILHLDRLGGRAVALLHSFLGQPGVTELYGDGSLVILDVAPR